MDKPEGDLPNSQPQDQTATSKPDTLTPPSASAEAATPEPAKIEVPAAPSQPEPVAAVESAATPEAAPIAAAIEAPKLEAAIVEPILPRLEDVRPAEAQPDETIAAADASLLSGWTASAAWARARRLAPLAATIAITAALGATAGSLATSTFGGAPASQAVATASQPVAPTADARALKDQVARLHTDIAALKASIDTSARSASAQSIKLGDRLDRLEKAQAEPAAKLAKLTDAVDRIERRAPLTSVASAAHDITGSVAALAPAPQLAGPPETRPASAPVLEGWRVRSVYNGAALIQSRVGGVMEVEPGDNLPGLGRIESIHRQDGKWVVVTSKGVIVTR